MDTQNGLIDTSWVLGAARRREAVKWRYGEVTRYRIR